MKIQKSFITRRVKPAIGTPDFTSIIGPIMTVRAYNNQYYGGALHDIFEKYMCCAWLPLLLFKMGYIQALADTGQNVQLNLEYSDKATVDKAIGLLVGTRG